MMKTRLAVSAAATGVAALGLCLATVSPAAAASGTWRSYEKSPIKPSTSEWGCAESASLELDVIAQACAIRSSDRKNVQAAIIVQNRTSTTFRAQASVDLWNTSISRIGEWSCTASTVGPKSFSVCYGATTRELDDVFVITPTVNGRSLPWTYASV
ncbi:hypothetical protein [Paractinoplanes maris]|uniref:hypothetical protein n=1 Tax=Paractinoplanes maris TaxID=1734446 RepID=UPI002021755E|nr:hypothetical protein [Actinoplanes maris]